MSAQTSLIMWTWGKHKRKEKQMEKVDFLSFSKGVGNVFDPFQWQHKETAKAVISKEKKMEGSLIFPHITVCSFSEAAGVCCSLSTVCKLLKYKALIPPQTQSPLPSCRVCARVCVCPCDFVWLDALEVPNTWALDYHQ